MAIKVVFPTGEKSVVVQGLYQWDYGQTLEIECPEIGSEIMEVHFACPNMTMAIPRPCTFNNGIGTVSIPDQCLEQGEAISAWVCRIDDTQSHTVNSITLPIVKRTKPIRTHEVPPELVDKYSELLTEVGEAVDALKNGNVAVAKAEHAVDANNAVIAKSAEYATYATSAGTANHANHAEAAGAINMKLVKEVIVTEGEGDVGIALEANTPYLIIYESSDTDYIGGGVIVTKTTAPCVCAITFNHAAYIRNWNNPLSCEVIISLEASTTTTTPASTNGILYIYTFGHIPEQ